MQTWKRCAIITIVTQPFIFILTSHHRSDHNTFSEIVRSA